MDTIPLRPGIMICFYYGLTAFACIWFFRLEVVRRSDLSFVFKFLFPLLGGLGLFAVLIITLRDSASPEVRKRGGVSSASDWSWCWASA